MTCFVVVDATPVEPEFIAQYSAKAAETLVPFNGRFLAKGEVTVLHGEAAHPLKAIIQFPDQESAQNWYQSEAYQALIPVRNQGMISHFHLV
ncbi:hypothetical protein VA7868_04579 [Vibrio aerogenes CECT 7868]|uniref:DUF1330 domain-containing protein n=1 Tax=Vibrio aerogenes CECT 7868 TaxID=1216006 RepID=A0A1M6F4R4_9VIBR|nr:DUF1330 domain-containing protein [Vibrio aerogenes]SHI92656.1 hypothetical protein VA7868_04579 [Vibrio aerogenes CECT 7868]